MLASPFDQEPRQLGDLVDPDGGIARQPLAEELQHGAPQGGPRVLPVKGALGEKLRKQASELVDAVLPHVERVPGPGGDGPARAIYPAVWGRADKEPARLKNPAGLLKQPRIVRKMLNRF
jgi:hypothetical protein